MKRHQKIIAGIHIYDGQETVCRRKIYKYIVVITLISHPFQLLIQHIFIIAACIIHISAAKDNIKRTLYLAEFIIPFPSRCKLTAAYRIKNVALFFNNMVYCLHIPTHTVIIKHMFITLK